MFIGETGGDEKRAYDRQRSHGKYEPQVLGNDLIDLELSAGLNSQAIYAKLHPRQKSNERSRQINWTQASTKSVPGQGKSRTQRQQQVDTSGR